MITFANSSGGDSGCLIPFVVTTRVSEATWEVMFYLTVSARGRTETQSHYNHARLLGLHGGGGVNRSVQWQCELQNVGKSV